MPHSLAHQDTESHFYCVQKFEKKNGEFLFVRKDKVIELHGASGRHGEHESVQANGDFTQEQRSRH